MSVHLCMGEIDSIVFSKETKHCEMATQPAPCDNEKHHQHEHPSSEADCCENHVVNVEGQDKITKTASFATPDLQFVAILYAVVTYLLAQPSVDTTFYKAYSPPLIERDIPVLFQSFLL